MVEAVLGKDRDEERFIRILAWVSFTGARRFVQIVAARLAASVPTGKPCSPAIDQAAANTLAA